MPRSSPLPSGGQARDEGGAHALDVSLAYHSVHVVGVADRPLVEEGDLDARHPRLGGKPVELRPILHFPDVDRERAHRERRLAAHRVEPVEGLAGDREGQMQVGQELRRPGARCHDQGCGFVAAAAGGHADPASRPPSRRGQARRSAGRRLWPSPAGGGPTRCPRDARSRPWSRRSRRDPDRAPSAGSAGGSRPRPAPRGPGSSGGRCAGCRRRSGYPPGRA